MRKSRYLGFVLTVIRSCAAQRYQYRLPSDKQTFPSSEIAATLPCPPAHHRIHGPYKTPVPLISHSYPSERMPTEHIHTPISIRTLQTIFPNAIHRSRNKTESRKASTAPSSKALRTPGKRPQLQWVRTSVGTREGLSSACVAESSGIFRAPSDLYRPQADLFCTERVLE